MLQSHQTWNTWSCDIRIHDTDTKASSGHFLCHQYTHTGFSYTALATHHTDDMTDFIAFIILDAAAVSLLAAGSLAGA